MTTWLLPLRRSCARVSPRSALTIPNLYDSESRECNSATRSSTLVNVHGKATSSGTPSTCSKQRTNRTEAQGTVRRTLAHASAGGPLPSAELGSDVRIGMTRESLVQQGREPSEEGNHQQQGR